MIPKEFYKEYMPLYTKDFDTEIYLDCFFDSASAIGSWATALQAPELTKNSFIKIDSSLLVSSGTIIASIYLLSFLP